VDYSNPVFKIKEKGEPPEQRANINSTNQYKTVLYGNYENNIKVYTFINQYNTINNNNINDKENQRSPLNKRVFVFDMDETIGAFSEFIYIWNILKDIVQENKQVLFNELLDMFPECMRQGIFVIMEYILNKKQRKECSHVMIYTNNIYSPDFPDYIHNYIDYRMRTHNFIDKIIYAYKANGVLVEQKRTSTKKTYSDFVQCANISPETYVCFLDDRFHNGMKNENLYYIHIKPYKNPLSKIQLHRRLIHSHIYKTIFGRYNLFQSLPDKQGNCEKRTNKIRNQKQNHKVLHNNTWHNKMDFYPYDVSGSVSIPPLYTDTAHTSKYIVYFIKLFFEKNVYM
jgi:hypothetical protein